MKVLLTLFMLFQLMFLSLSSHAADGSSGCGPGWYLMQDNSLVSSALRATTNAVLIPVVTIGMTFGTSNCTRHKLVQKEKQSLHFATMNYFELKGEIAKGSGEFLAAFSHTLGCHPSALHTLNRELKNNYSNIFSTSTIQPDQTLVEVYKVILRQPELIKKCSIDIG